MQREAFDAYLQLEHDHFWRRAKRRLVLEWIEHASPPRGGRVLDVGGAACLITRQLSRFGAVTVVEPDAAMVELARRVGALEVVRGGLPGLPVAGPFALVTMLDVLEHLRDDHAALRELRGVLRPGGLLVVTVPAYMWLWSEHDVALAHVRRYTRSGLRRRLEGAGFQVIRDSYYTSALLPVMAAQRLAARVGARVRSRAASRYRTSAPPGPVNRLFGRVMDVERRVLRATSLPAGGSIIAVCRRR